jgi:hypothetical protein
MKDYFDGYYLLQKTAIEVMTVNYPKEPYFSMIKAYQPSVPIQASYKKEIARKRPTPMCQIKKLGTKT